MLWGAKGPSIRWNVVGSCYGHIPFQSLSQSPIPYKEACARPRRKRKDREKERWEGIGPCSKALLGKDDARTGRPSSTRIAGGPVPGT